VNQKKTITAKDQAKRVGHIVHSLKLPAIPITQSGHTLYVFAAKSSVLYDALSINRRAVDKDEGYQRVLSPSRVQALTRYLLEKRPIPGAIIVSLDEAVFDTKKRQLTIPAGKDVGWVIDGQHRLAGAAMAARAGTDVEIAVIAFIGLRGKDQIEQFITINREAKNVPTSLYLDLLHHLPNRRGAEVVKERASDLATQLRKDEGSPFFERIAVVTAPRPGQISLVNFVRKISLLITKNGILSTFTEREQLSIISNYYQGLRNVFSKEYDARESIFFKTIGFGALWNVFPTVFSLALRNQKGFTVKDVATIFKRIDGLDFSTWAQYGTGDQAERNAAEDLRATLFIAFRTDDDAAVSTINL
jgi:DGQHR domain-containing protein